MQTAFYNRKRNKARQDEGKFDAVILNNANIAGGYTLPANCQLAYSCSTAKSAGGLNVLVTASQNRTLPCPAISANQIVKIGYFEKGTKISFSTGVISLYVVKNNGVIKKIGQGTFP